MASAANQVRKPRITPDSVPLSMQAGDQVMVLLPVEIRRRNHDGTFMVVGSGINRTVEARELLRRTDISK